GKSEWRDGVQRFKNVALSVENGSPERGIGVVLLHQTPGQEFLRLIIAGFHPQALRDAIFDFVGVGACGIGIETDELKEIVNAGDIAISDVRFDGVLVALAKFSLVGRDSLEEAFQRRGTKVESELTVVAHEGLRADDTGGSEGRSVIGGAKSGSSRGAEPRAEMERHRHARRELRARNEIWSV